MQAFSEGTDVAWTWGNGTGTGKIEAVFTQDVTRTLKGTEVTRNASPDCPAYLIVQEDGTQVLKSHSEVSAT